MWSKFLSSGSSTESNSNTVSRFKMTRIGKYADGLFTESACGDDLGFL